MKRKTMALLLALSMCLLSACGSGGAATGDKPSENTVSSTEQQPEESEEPEESETPAEEEPEELPELPQEEPKEEHAGTKLLALLQEEYQNGFVEGERPEHTFFNLIGVKNGAAIYNGVVYIRKGQHNYWAYDIASKELRESISTNVEAVDRIYFMDGNFYYLNSYLGGNVREATMFDCNGTLLKSIQQEGAYENPIAFEDGILAFYHTGNAVLLSYNLEKIADIPAPQREIEHGLKEDIYLAKNNKFVADGTVYVDTSSKLYRLNTTTYEWEDTGIEPFSRILDSFCGKYVTMREGIYDHITGELVFEYGELYPVANYNDGLCYFGGDQYLGKKGNEYRWVNLTDLTMSDPLPFPENPYELIVLNDTYCVYYDEYGWFLWNYIDGTEETIMMFES